MGAVRMHSEVARALGEGRPVVALESAAITHGLPREPAPATPPAVPGWNPSRPVNLELALAMDRAVRSTGAIPALVAVMDGELRIGLDEHEVERLASTERAGKASTRDLAMAIETGRTAGTTVAATLQACLLAQPRPIRVFATGGVGGVHRQWTLRPDISADLAQLATSPVCVVSAGMKAVLDITATLEALDGLRVPIVGYRTSHLPLFVCSGDPRVPLSHRLDDPRAIACLCARHWESMGCRSAVLVAQEIDATLAIEPSDYEAAVATAEGEAQEADIIGAERTPFLLRRIAQVTQGRSLAANLALLVANARLAGEIATGFVPKTMQET